MAAYVIVDVQGVRDPAGMAEYASKVGAVVERYGGTFLVPRAQGQPLENDWAPTLVILQFDNADQARRWYDSPEYRPLLELRKKSGDMRLTVVESA